MGWNGLEWVGMGLGSLVFVDVMTVFSSSDGKNGETKVLNLNVIGM